MLLLLLHREEYILQTTQIVHTLSALVSAGPAMAQLLLAEQNAELVQRLLVDSNCATSAATAKLLTGMLLAVCGGKTTVCCI